MVKITKQDTTYYGFTVQIYNNYYYASKVILVHYTTLAAAANNLAKVMCVFSVIVVALYSAQFQDLLNRSTEPHIEAGNTG